MSERSNEDWGRVAVSLPGWRWMDGAAGHGPLGEFRVASVMENRTIETDSMAYMCDGNSGQCTEKMQTVAADVAIPDVDDPATAGCLLALLGPGGAVRHDTDRGGDPNTYTAWCDADGRGDGPTPGRAIVALAESLGHWPGGTT